MSSDNTKPLIFILEDDRQLRDVLVRTFEEHGFDTESFGLIANFERRLRQKKPAICLVDMRLPDGQARDLAVRGPHIQNTPVIIISGVWTEMTDRVLGLEMGADDYLVKPFNPREAVARVRAVLRRCADTHDTEDAHIAAFAGWKVDFASHLAQSPEGVKVELSTGDANLLRGFASQAQRVLTRDYLMEHFCASSAFDRSIDVRVSRLRQKLGENPRNPKIIKTIHGAGYLFAPKVVWLSHQSF